MSRSSSPSGSSSSVLPLSGLSSSTSRSERLDESDSESMLAALGFGGCFLDLFVVFDFVDLFEP